MIEPGIWRRLRYRCGQLANAHPTMTVSNRTLRVRTVVFDMRPFGYHISPHFHAEYQLLIYLEAETPDHETKSQHPIARGQTVLLSPEIRHDWTKMNPSCQIFAVFFSLNPACEFPIREHWPVYPELADAVEHFSDLLLRAKSSELSYASAYLMAVIHQAISLFTPGMPKRTQQARAIDLPEAIQQLVFNDPPHHWTLSEIASHFGVSTRHLSRLFHADSGDTIFTHITRCRLDYARALLRESDSKIGEIGVRSGFQEQAYFCRCFRRYLGLTPSAYRQLAKGEKDSLS